jgi:hypothetical protein
MRRIPGKYNCVVLQRSGHARRPEKLTIFDDAGAIDGASVQLVREHFRRWWKRAVYKEQHQEQVHA